MWPRGSNWAQGGGCAIKIQRVVLRECLMPCIVGGQPCRLALRVDERLAVNEHLEREKKSLIEK